MEKIQNIRFNARNEYFSKQKPLKIDLIENSIWSSVNQELKLKTLQVFQESRLIYAKKAEKDALIKEGYTVIRGKTLQEWQDYFCKILENKKIKLNFNNLDEFILKQIFTKEQYSKLMAVLYSANNIKINEKFLLDRNHIF
jgi:hypothetical protein